MTRLRGASFDGTAGSERSQYCRSKLPSNVPEVIVENTVEVTDPSRVLPWYRDERRRRFNILVRRYKNQLLHGCDDPGCRTPTCASQRRRVSEGPYRRYTELSARTLACYLASQDDAESGLCCNNPRYTSEMTIHDYHRISLQRSRAFQAHATAAPTQEDHRGPSAATEPADDPNLEERADKFEEQGTANITGDFTEPTLNATQPNTFNFQDLDFAPEQPLKDPKSFTQNLFDTLSLRMVEWLPLRRTTENLNRLKSQAHIHPENNERPIYHKRQDREADKSEPEISQTPPSHARNPLPRTPSSRPSGTQSSAVELTFQNQHVKRLSIPEVDSWRQSTRSSIDDKKRQDYKGHKFTVNAHLPSGEFAAMPSPPALKHRPQKHRGRVGDKQDRVKNQRRVSWDSEKLLTGAAVDEGHEHTQPPLPQVDMDNTPTTRKPKLSSMRRTSSVAPLAQTISQFTPEIIDGLSQVMIPSEEDAEIWREELDRIQSMGSFDNPDWTLATPRQRQVFPFVAQSAYYVFSSTGQILRSFGKDAPELDTTANKMNKRLDVSRLQGSLQRLFTICPWDIALHSLWSSLDKLFVPPDELASSGRPSRRSSRSSTMTSSAPPVVRRLSESANNDHLSDADAAYIATIAFFVLVSSVPVLDLETWRGILRMRAAGTIASSADMQKLSPEYAQQAVEATDRFEHELGLRLINRLVRALAARLAYHEISKARQVYSLDLPKQRKINVLDRIMDHLSEQLPHRSSETDSASSQPTGPTPLILEWLRTLFLREWDGNPEMARSGAAGGAVQILALMYKERNRLGLSPEDFHTPILAERLDPLEMPIAWLGNLSNNRTIHLLSYPFMFPPSSLVIYFRALNYSVMSKYYEAAMTTTRHVTQTAFGSISIADDAALLARMKISMSTYLVLVVRRDSVLTDALNQLWRREKRELMRPLKVQMGMDEGEEGLDHGGVQQEFFRVLMGEALDPSYGMFTMDSRHRVSWFQPCSWEPVYKFELIGLLMSIAVYNGLTLPINFPVAFYRKLLGLKVKHLDHIRDGWPELAQGLDSLLTWTDGDVGDVFMRTYEFSFESAGRVETVDMQKVGRDEAWPASKAPSADTDVAWSDSSRCFVPDSVHSMAAEASDRTSTPPSTPTLEAPLVTNQNRTQFVKDYIFWLTDKSIRPQFEAFLRGFHTCLDRSALSIFTPEALKTVVEGFQDIDVTELEHHTRYEGGFGPHHRVIRDFWSVVRNYSAEKKAQLLEFVTASDRVPVNGISSIMFVIQKNGVGDLRLPTSLTCFGRLLLPEYSSKKALEEKLDKALENARGFGFA
ncbi:Ubiquitin-protein ligase E3A [Penicillium rolfsii]|nr:Ubiquitin-protein ligase E3A [Penicillium rolfsii]